MLISMRRDCKSRRTDMRHKTLFSDKLRFIYLQLPLFRKEPDDCGTIFEKIIYTLKNLDILQRRPDLFQGHIFKNIASIADVASMTKEEREQYDIHLRQYRDTIAVLEGQYQEGMEDGMQKGMEKGIAEGELNEKLRIALTMKASNAPVEQIAQWTGLPVETIKNLN